jgi:predicted amidohydrolase YtcJ
VKFFADGALGSRGALLIEPYSDAPDVFGIELLTAAELVESAAPAIERGFAIATHAIGDRAVRNVIDAYEVLRERYPDALLRIEHAQIVHPSDILRMAHAGIIAAVQPTHCISDAAMAVRRLGPERAADAYRWRSLIDAGITIIAGSDFPVESPSALAGLRAFVDRDPGDGVWYGSERITREEALDAFTSAALTGVTFPRRTGRIHPGYAADLTIVSGDPFSSSASVALTVLAGTPFRFA